MEGDALRGAKPISGNGSRLLQHAPAAKSRTVKGCLMVNPFDLKTVVLAKHAQHVVLIHFPIALFITAVAFDLSLIHI